MMPDLENKGAAKILKNNFEFGQIFSIEIKSKYKPRD